MGEKVTVIFAGLTLIVPFSARFFRVISARRLIIFSLILFSKRRRCRRFWLIHYTALFSGVLCSGRAVVY